MTLDILSSIFLSICFFIVLLCNLKMKNKIIHSLFLIFGLIYIILILIFDNNFIYPFLKSTITYIWYPNYFIFVLVIISSVVILIITLLNNKKSKLFKIISYFLFSICLACYIIFLELDIDPNLYSSLYQKNSLFLMRIVTISFLIWLLICIYVKVRGKNEK